MGLPGKSLQRDILYGVSIIGKIDTANPLALRNASDTTGMGHAKQNTRARNGPVAKSIPKAADPVARQGRWGLSVEDPRKGWASSLDHVAAFGRLDAAISPRFWIAMPDGITVPKYRLFDDSAKSLVNGR